ncbi:hypothetical protein GGS20DRAFT_576042 [Poronia punctata]|nr:hypothetical protein GGS20DRAFT_576042 [Poronia punctata]
MAGRVKLNVQSFPRPPLIEKTPRHLRVIFNGKLIADTTDAYWVLETHHPPTYYLPPSSLHVALKPTTQSSFCEWKGRATYYSLSDNDGGDVVNRVWSYNNPTEPFKSIAGYLSFYAGPWDCYVDGEKVEPQPGSFYGGWVTSDIEGIVKGRMGNVDPL